MSSPTGVPVSAVESERLVRVPMSYEDYLGLPEGRVEWVDGQAIFMSASPRSGHQRVARRLADLIEDATGLSTVEAVGFWTIARRRSRIPDVLATREPFDDSWTPQLPVLVAEVLAASTRSEDTIRKSQEYLRAGVAQYLLVDPEHRELVAYRNTGEEWEELFAADAAHPRGSVPVGDVGTVSIDLEWLLRP